MKYPQKKEKGILFWKKRWFSICSIHMEYNEDCPRCNKGSWVNLHSLSISHFFHKYFYKLWFYYQNGTWPDHKYEDLLK